MITHYLPTKAKANVSFVINVQISMFTVPIIIDSALKKRDR